jgi:hypothetical protein
MEQNKKIGNSESEQRYYFFMKVGYANSFLPYVDSLGGLLVGFVGDAVPHVDGDGFCRRNGEKLDLIYAAVAASPKWRSKARIVTYSKDALMIWRPTGNMRTLERSAGGLDWGKKDLYSKFPKEWHDDVKAKWGGFGSEEFYRYHFGEKGWKVIPAELDTVISRELLIAPIDSLAVWQNFSRNTFQPMFSLTGNPSLSRVEWLDQVSDLPAFAISDMEKVEEGRFGKFVRVYLNGKGATKNEVFVNLDREERKDTALATLNPAQVETATMLICRDLGLTVDVGLGKGLDVVDVKATVRHLETEERKRKIQAAITTLESIGVVFSQKLRHSIQSTATIRIQCKAAPGIEAEGTVLVVETCPSGGATAPDRVSLEQLAHSSLPLPEFREWLTLLDHDLAA